MITAQLFALQDQAYADFQSKLLPTVQHETMIGVRTPDLRKKDTHNKTIQKAIESFRITDEQKALLKSLRIK